MTSKRSRLTRQLLHPATLIALLALFVATTGAAYALVITGAQIKNGSVTGADIKNHSLGAVDLAATAKGARAVATVWSDGTHCFIIGATSRGFSSCSRGNTGDYELTVAPGVSMAGTYPICSRGSNGGFNSLYQFSCDVGIPSPGHVRLRLIREDETGTGAPEPTDSTQTIPYVVVLP